MTKRSLDCIYRALENYNLLELYLTTRLDDYDDFYCKFACIRGALIQLCYELHKTGELQKHKDLYQYFINYGDNRKEFYE